MNIRRPLDSGPAGYASIAGGGAREGEFASIERSQRAIAALRRVVSGITVRQDDVGPSEQYPISHVTIIDSPAEVQRPEFYDQDGGIEAA